jgi:hypothetical protein
MRRLAAALIVILVALPLLGAAFSVVSVSTWLLDRRFYVSLVSDPRLFEIPRGGTTRWAGDAFVIGGMDGPAALSALREVVTPAWMQGQAESAVNQVFDFLQGRTERFDISVDLHAVKAALAGEPGRRFAAVLARELPVGSASAPFRVDAHALPTVRPSTLSVEKAAAAIQAGLPAFTAGLPDTAHLADSPWYQEDGSWVPRFAPLNALVAADTLLVLLAAGALAAAAFAGGATRFERVQWAAWPLLVPAAGTFLFGLLVTVGLGSGLMHWSIEHARLGDAGFSPAFVDAVAAAAQRVVARVGTGFIATGAVAGGTAAGLLAWGRKEEA